MTYLVAQGIGGLAWWSMLLAWPATRTAFLAEGAPDSTLLAFAGSDLLLFAAGSLAAGWGLARNRAWACPVLCLHTGAAVYAGLYCLTLWWLDPRAWLGAVMMTPPLIVPAVITWWYVRAEGERKRLPLEGALTGRTRVASGRTGEILPATTVRTIAKGEKVDGLIREVAQSTYESKGREHAIISLRGGGRVIVRGGSGGIRFGDDLKRVLLHTHPTTTGPSPADFQMLEQLGQRHSYIYELFGGGLSRFDR